MPALATGTRQSDLPPSAASFSVGEYVLVPPKRMATRIAHSSAPPSNSDAAAAEQAPVLQYRQPWPHFVPTIVANCTRPFFSNSFVLEIPARNVKVWTLMAA